VAAALAALVPDEQARANALSPSRQRGFVAGRTALRRALGPAAAGVAIGSDDRGAPIVPAGWVGSLSHKASFAAALVAPVAGAHIGVDLERAVPPRGDISARVLTPRELASLPGDPVARGRAVTLAFSIKEAIYKAIDPYVRRYVGFLEVELVVADDGAATVTSALPFVIEATWRELDGHWLTTARACPA
jgi:enterobactin synthetase component D